MKNSLRLLALSLALGSVGVALAGSTSDHGILRKVQPMGGTADPGILRVQAGRR